MLYPSAAYLVIFKMVLLFATSEAVIDMEIAKKTVRELFSSFTDTVLDFQAEKLNDLMVVAEYLTSDEKVEAYLVEVAKNGNICKIMLEKIDDYVENFRKLLNEAKFQTNQDSYIPLMDKLKQLRKMSPSQAKRHTKRNKDSTSVSSEADIPDKYGFRIQKGKQEVKSLLDVFLQLAFDTKCNDIQSLASFSNSLLDDTNLYKVLSQAVNYLPCKSTIMSHIDKYMRDFREIPNVGGGNDDVKLIPMKEILRSIRQRCVYPGDPSRDPLEEIIQ